MAANIVPTLERKAKVIQAKPDRHTPMRQVAESLDRRLATAATVELVTESLCRLAELVYSQDRAGRINVDAVTGRILIPVPWGKAGQRYWGLYPSESNTLRAILRSRQRRKNHVPLFWYDRERRAWCVNLQDYPTLASALGYLEKRPITVEEWRHFYAQVKRPR